MTHDLVAVKCTVAYTKLLILTGRTFAMAKTWWDPCKFALKLLWIMVPAVEQHALLTWLHNQQDNEINWEKLLGTTSLTHHHQVSDHASHHFSTESSTEAQ